MYQARKYYESALRMEPGFLGAALALAELHVMESRLDDAVSLLLRYLKDWTDDSLHVKLAQVYASKNMPQAALSHYQSALRYHRFSKQISGILSGIMLIVLILWFLIDTSWKKIKRETECLL